ncbi:MAG: hypothetical protein SGILL_006714 [Bacillariaceae sp.]
MLSPDNNMEDLTRIQQSPRLQKARSRISLAAARRTAGGKAKPGRKAGGPSAKPKKGKGKTTTGPRASASASGPPKKKQSNNNKHTAPPWQTISQKDMAKNVKAEKERRKLAQTKGQHLSPAQLEELQADFTRSTDFLSATDKALLSWKPFALNSNRQQVLFQGAFLNKQLPPRLGVPEVAFLGRSNVGKSSLLNKLVNKSDLARVGKTPGATASVNLYGIFEETSKKNAENKPMLGLVDLPGFGYAKLDKKTKESVQETAERYLEKRDELALGVLLVDSRRVPSVDDKAVLAALFDMGLPLIVVATKVDKLSSQRQVEEALDIINRELGLPEEQPLCISSVTGQGIKELWKIILEACEGRVEELRNTLEKGGPDDDIDVPLASSEQQKETFDDDAEIAYSQGYDWVHGSVMYEVEEGDYVEDDDDIEEMNEEESDDEDDWYSDPYALDERDVVVPQKLTMKDLRRKAKEMEKRGEL